MSDFSEKLAGSKFSDFLSENLSEFRFLLMGLDPLLKGSKFAHKTQSKASAYNLNLVLIPYQNGNLLSSPPRNFRCSVFGKNQAFYWLKK